MGRKSKQINRKRIQRERYFAKCLHRIAMESNVAFPAESGHSFHGEHDSRFIMNIHHGTQDGIAADFGVQFRKQSVFRLRREKRFNLESKRL